MPKLGFLKTAISSFLMFKHPEHSVSSLFSKMSDDKKLRNELAEYFENLLAQREQEVREDERIKIIKLIERFDMPGKAVPGVIPTKYLIKAIKSLKDKQDDR
jgi:Ca2+-binding EF-hand superfamily protein